MSARLALLTVFLALAPAMAAEQASNPALDAEIAKIDAVTADPDRKMIAAEAIARRLGTHRNHLLLLRRQTGRSYGHIFVSRLEAAGKNHDEILAEVRAVNRQLEEALRRFQRLGGDQEGGSPPPRPILYLGAGVDHNSTGTFYTLVPEVGIDTRRLSFVVGVPYYKNSGTQLSAAGIGDIYASGLVRGRAGRYDLGANLVVGFPTGDSSKGLGAAKTTFDVSGIVQRRFERLRPFLKAGVANSIFNNVGYQRPYISTGSAAHLSGGVDVRALSRLTIGVGGFAVRPWGTQTVHSRMNMQMSAMGGADSMPGNDTPGAGMPGTGMPGMGTPGAGMPGMGLPGAGSGTVGGTGFQPPDSGGNMPVYALTQQSVVQAEELRDHGVAIWASFRLRTGITLNFAVARSIPFELTTVGFGLGFDFARLLFPGKHF